MTRSAGGVSILIRKSFEEQFSGLGSSPPTFQEVIPGRIGTLALDGDAGRLQVTVVYGTSGGNAEHHAARYEELSALSGFIPDPDEVLCLAAGDWNIVMSQQDRYHVPEQIWTGIKDKPDADLFQKSMCTMKCWHEVANDHYTHYQKGCQVYSIIDRAYTNQFVTDQLDRYHNSAIYPWCKKLSSHRPLHFIRTEMLRTQKTVEPFPTQVLSLQEWPELLTSQYRHPLEKLSEGERDNAYMRGLTLKQLGWRVAKFLAISHAEKEVQVLEGKVSCSIRALRAFARKDWKTLCTCRDQFPRLNEALGKGAITERDKKNRQRAQHAGHGTST